MKKLVLSLVVMLVSFAAVADKPINVGVKFGTSLSNLKTKNVKDIDFNSYLFGAFARVNVGPLYVEPGLNYVVRSTDKIDRSTGYKGDFKVKSFEVPVMVGMQLINIKILKVRTYLGPQITFGDYKELNSFIKEVGNPADAIDNNVSSWQFKAGVGVDVWKLTFDADYAKTLKKISSMIDAPHAFNFTVGYKIF